MTGNGDERLGAHVSTQGGVATAPGRGVAIGATAIQLFTKTPNQWRDPSIDEVTAEQFRKAFLDSGLRAAVSHDSYLINLASPDPVLNQRSVLSFTAELQRCTALGLPYIVSHPGNYMDDPQAGLERNSSGYAKALRAVPGEPMVLLETTAGTGTALGSRFEELAQLREAIPEDVRHRIAYCADTCHLYAAGYDLVGDFDGVWNAFDRILGLDRLRVLHLNDSKHPLGSHKDRHELIGEGTLGEAPFRAIMRDPRFAHVIKLLETPKGDDEVTNDRRMLERLRTYAGGPDR